MTPITPQECIEQKQLHPTMIKVVNELLKKHFIKHSCEIDQKEIIKEFKKIEKGYTTNKIIDEGLLNFEDFYRNAGWKVTYHSPDRDERGFDEYFEFSIIHHRTF